MTLPDLSKYAKFVTAIIGAALVIAAAFAPGKYDGVLQVVVAVATALGVYAVPNAEPTGE